jgi:WD40 repeat protein
MEINSRGHVATTNETSVNQFVTIAGDGQVCFWDLRFKEPKYRCTSRLKAEKIANKDASPDIHFTPIYSISLNKTDSSGELGLKSFSFEKQKEESDNNSSFSSRFYCGTEEGEFVYADWRPHAATKSVFSKDDENGNGEEGVQYVQWVHRDHFRPIINVSFSPFFPSISMTVGETSFHLWNTAQNKGAEGNSPIFISPLSLTAITCAAFSPSRPGVIYIGKADGNLEVWDFLDQSHKASLSVGVTACALTSIEFRPVVSNSNGVINPTVASGTGATKSGIAAGKSSNNANTNVNLKQQLVAVGDQNGNLHILEIPRTLARGPSGERQAMEAYFKRESERLKCRYDSAAAATGVTGAKTNSANTRDEPVVQPTKNSNNEKEPSEDELFKRMEIEFRKELGIEAA